MFCRLIRQSLQHQGVCKECIDIQEPGAHEVARGDKKGPPLERKGQFCSTPSAQRSITLHYHTLMPDRAACMLFMRQSKC